MSLVERLEKSFVGTVSKTKQEFKAEADINLIMKRFKKVQGADYLAKFSSCMAGEFGDFSNVTDYRTALDSLSKADEVFGRLPARVRAQFLNKTANFLDALHDPKQVDALVAMGLLKKAEVPKAVASESAVPSVVPTAGVTQPVPPAG